MESSADVVGVDILLFPVEEEQKAPSPSELPMPSFGFQGVEIEGEFQPPSGRDIPSVTVEEQRDMADQAVNLAASRTGWQTRTEPPAPRTVASATRTPIAPASSCKAAPSPPPPPPLPPPPPQSAGIDCTPTAPPRYAGDALLTTSGQDMHTELTLSRVVGGAVSVKLKSWQQKIIMKAAPEQDIQRNIRAVIGLCQLQVFSLLHRLSFDSLLQ